MSVSETFYTQKIGKPLPLKIEVQASVFDTDRMSCYLGTEDMSMRIQTKGNPARIDYGNLALKWVARHADEGGWYISNHVTDDANTISKRGHPEAYLCIKHKCSRQAEEYDLIVKGSGDTFYIDSPTLLTTKSSAIYTRHGEQKFYLHPNKERNIIVAKKDIPAYVFKLDWLETEAPSEQRAYCTLL